jgi:hypothetical protein
MLLCEARILLAYNAKTDENVAGDAELMFLVSLPVDTPDVPKLTDDDNPFIVPPCELVDDDNDVSDDRILVFPHSDDAETIT